MNDFSQRVVDWQRQHGRQQLPWIGQDAYCVWLSEIMLQQTQVTTVLPYYAAFTARFPTVGDLANACIDEVLAMWAGLGYYSRARNLHRCAQTVVAQHGGQFPADVLQLQALPGIGPSSAGAVASMALGQRAAILDGNVKRLLARHGGIAGWPGESAVSKQLWMLANKRLCAADAAVPADHHRRYTQGLMDLGAQVCTIKAPACAACPVARDCAAHRTGAWASIPASKPKKTMPQQQRCAVVLHTTHGVWLERRPLTGLWGGLLCLPEADTVLGLHSKVQTLLHAASQPAAAPQGDLASLVSKPAAATPTVSAPMLQPWRKPLIKHTFTHYQLHWQLWQQAVDTTLKLPPPWVFASWDSVHTVGVPKAVLKALDCT